MKRWLLIATIFFVVGFLLRSWQLGQIPVSLYWDEVAMLVDAKAIVATGHDMHGRPWLQTMFPSYGDYKLPVYIWLTTVAVRLVGVSQLAVRLPSLVAGLLTMITAAAIGWYLFEPLGKKEPKRLGWQQLQAVFSVAVVAVSPWAIMFSRTGFEGYLAQSLVALAVLVQLLSRKKNWWLVFVPVLGAIATYTYFSVRFVWPVIFVITQLALSEWPRKWPLMGKKIVLTMVLPLLAYGLLLWPMFHSPLYSASNQFRLSTVSVLNAHDYAVESNQLRELGGNSLLDRVLYHRQVLMLRELAKNFADHFDPTFLFLNGDSNLRHGTGHHGLFLWPLIIPWILGLLFLIKKYPRRAVVLIAWWLIALLPASVPETTPHALRSLNALVPLSIIIATGLSASWVWLGQPDKKVTRWLKPSIGVIWLMCMLVATVEFSWYYFAVYPRQSASDWQGSFKETALFLLEQAPEVHQIYNEFTDDRLYLWMMAFGPFSGNEFVTWTSQGWMFLNITTILRERFEINRLETGEMLGVFARTDELAEREKKWVEDGATIISETKPPSPYLFQDYTYVVLTRK